MAELTHLSDAWIAALDEAAAGHEGLRVSTLNTTLVLEYRVALNPPVCWHIIIDCGEVRIRSGSAEQPDVWFEAQPATASSLLDGSLDPLSAVIDGTLTMGGDPRLLVPHRQVLNDLGDVFLHVRTATDTGGR